MTNWKEYKLGEIAKVKAYLHSVIDEEMYVLQPKLEDINRK